MKIPTSLSALFCRSLIAAGGLAVSVSVHAGLAIPYTSNPDTMHLWHMNDTNGSNTVDAVATDPHPSPNAYPIALTNYGEPTPTVPPFTNSFFGTAAYYPELGTSYTGTTKQNLLYGGTFPDVSQFRNPTSGAFTFEALVLLNTTFNPSDIEILAGDNGGAITARGWQWRIFNGTMEWDLLAGATDNDFKPSLPTSGPDAVAANVWFHAAITYTGQSPTNGDTPNIITMYWTRVDGSRTNADVLAQFTATRPLDGSPSGASTPSLGIWGSARSLSNPGNNEGGIGSVDEVRVSDLALNAYSMAFTNNGQLFPPTITTEPPANVLAAYGGTLTINCGVSASSPTYKWLQFTTNSTNVVPNQASSSLNITNITFANGGSYVLIVSNSLNVVTSTVAVVTIGASATGFYNTGVDTNGQVTAADVPDVHYELIQSQDLNYLGPAAMVFEWNNPIEFAPGSAGYAPTNGSSIWIGDQGNPGGVFPNSVPGNYIYRANLLLDQVNPSTLSFGGTIGINGTLSNLLINGQSTGFSVAPGAPLYTFGFTVSNFNNILYITASGATITSQSFSVTNTTTNAWFVPGLNTIDFVENITGGQSALLLENATSLGQALPASKPAILSQPASQIVEDSSLAPVPSSAAFSVVATGRSPITYQWYENSNLLSGANSRVLAFNSANGNAPSNGPSTNYFSVVISNASGAVTSSVASLSIVESNLAPVCPTFNVVAFGGAGTTIEISDLLVLVDSDPSGGQLTFLSSDGSSTNGGGISQISGTLAYTPVSGYVGSDQFTYSIADADGNTSVGIVNLQNFLSPTPATQAVPPGDGIPITYTSGVTNVPAGYKFQWQLNGTNLPGATGVQYTIANPAAGNTGNYELVVTDPSGVVWPSPLASLIVEGYPPYALPIANIFDSSEQGSFPATNAVDDNFTDYWVSYGTVAGQQPTATSPEWLFVMFPRTVALSEFLIYPRSGYGPNAIKVIVNSQLAPGTPPNGSETYGIPTNGTTIYTGSMANTAAPLDVVLAAPTNATNVQLYITSSYSADNVQVSEMIFNERALPGTFGDWELKKFTAAQINNPAVSSPFADADGDGVPNLQEFAVGGNPLVKDATNAAMQGFNLSGNQVAVQYQVTNNLGDVSLQYQASPDLANWTNVVPTAVNLVTNRGTVSIMQAVFPKTPPLLYYRLDYGLTNVIRY